MKRPQPDRGKSAVKRTRPRTANLLDLVQPQDEFDLFASVEESRDKYDKRDTETIKWLSLHRIPKYVRANLDRVIAGEDVSHEEARWCCIEFGVQRIARSEEYGTWKQLCDLATSKKTTYKNDADWDDVQERLTTFHFKPHNLHTGTYSTNARIPEPIKAQVGGIAKVLGMSASTLATICFIDALRELDSVMHKTDMDETINEFYLHLSRRTTRLGHLLVEIEVLEPRERR